MVWRVLFSSPLPSSLAPAPPALWPQPTANSNLHTYYFKLVYSVCESCCVLHTLQNSTHKKKKLYDHYHSHCTFIPVRFRFLWATALFFIKVKVGYILSDGGSGWSALLWLLLQLSLPDLGQSSLKKSLTLCLKLLSLLTLSVRLRERQIYNSIMQR